MTQDAGQDRSAARPAFVLHDHRVPRPHFDLRLEQDGVLRSWALPRGLPTDATQQRLAIAVPDHDMDHLTYRDETKLIADTGWWEQIDRNDWRFLFTLHGQSGSRRYALIRTEGYAAPGSANQEHWLLRLTKDQPA